MRTTTLALAALLAGPAAAAAQGLTVNPYAGYYDFDESSFEDAVADLETDGEILWGARLGFGDPEGLSYDLAYGRTSVTAKGVIGTEELVAFDEEATIQLFYGAANWHLPIPGPLDLFVSGGAGAIQYDRKAGGGQTDVLVNFGAGASLPIGPARIRIDVKDHVDLCRADDFEFPEGPCFDDETLQNIEISAGIVIGT
jgi:hypothetical protein